MSTFEFILKKHNLRIGKKTLIEIPNVGRNHLAKWLSELDFKIGVEVGVAAGAYSEILLQANPQMKLYGVDPWKPYNGYQDYTKRTTFKKLYDKAVRRLTKYPNYEFIRQFSMKAIKRFANNSLDFVYIDANHANPYITQDITEWSKKVRIGGIVAGHDYIRVTKRGENGEDIRMDVKEAVNNYVASHKIRPWFLIGLKAKIPGMIRDSSRSWMWAKQ